MDKAQPHQKARMTRSQHPTSKPNSPKKDEDRLAQALRENLFRRKAQARARTGSNPPESTASAAAHKIAGEDGENG
jgi:hypothetical protein